jgi:thioredoxin-like negative regulator of GroEL
LLIGGRTTETGGVMDVGFDHLHNSQGGQVEIGSSESRQHDHGSLPREVTWPLPQLGPLPALAPAFQERPGVRERVAAAQARGAGVVLSGDEGEGKSQLAASYAHQACGDGADLVLWVAAAEMESVITAYAEAGARVGVVPENGSGDPYADSRAFTGWLTGTGKTWLVVLDDITDPAAMGSWWPTSDTGSGRVLGTTRQRGALVSAAGRELVEVGVYLPEESRDYLSRRLSDHGGASLLDERVDDLAAEVGHLPLALSHAAAYMIDQLLPCAEYLNHFSVEGGRLDELRARSADTDTCGRAVATTWSLSIMAANAAAPVGLAVPATRLAAVLDPAGHPEALWASEGVRNYLTANRAIPEPRELQRLDREPITHTEPTDEPVTSSQARAAMLTLDRFGLITREGHDRQESEGNSAAARAVRMNGLTQEAVIGRLDHEALADAVWAAADALLSIWPDVDVHADAEMAAVLRSNTIILARGPGADALWQPYPHRLLYRAGESLEAAGLVEPAIAYWTTLRRDAERLLGADHPHALTVRANLARSYLPAGRTTEAIALLEEVAADSDRLLGAEHPITVKIRGALAASYQSVGRNPESIEIKERLAADSERLLGAEHPDTLAARAKLATSYQGAGRTDEAIGLLEQVAADSERLLGAEHPDTLATRANLASSYWSAERTTEAIGLLDKAAADSERLLGAEHPDTLAARANLATSYQGSGRTAEAIEIEEQVAADSERLLGTEHPDTLSARAKLAGSYLAAGRTTEAIGLLEHVAADAERLLGAEHPDTLAARAKLAGSYQGAGRTAEAIGLLEQVAADSERLLGAAHPATLIARGNLACSFLPVGRTDEAIGLLEQVTADLERILSAEHPETLTARNNLARSYWAAGRTAEAIELLERLAADLEGLLGAEHPAALTARASLAVSYLLAGRTTEAIGLQEQVAADLERLLGAEHPDTLMARAKLAGCYDSAGRTSEAIGLLEQVAVDLERKMGAEHPDTQSVRKALDEWTAR